MMNKYLLLFLVLPAISLFSQQKISVPDIRAQYESFEYQKVISMADSALKNSDVLSQREIIDIYVLKAESWYALGDIEQARVCFVSLLKVRNDYAPDEETMSPKIIGLFNQVRAEMQGSSPVQVKPQTAMTVADNPDEKNAAKEHMDRFQMAIIRSAVLPGWGQLGLRADTKSWLITSVAAANIISLTYYSIRTNTKEHSYLNSSDQQSIPGLYASYNASYKIRNTLITTLVGIWLYSQYDLFTLPGEMYTGKLPTGISLNSGSAIRDISLSYHLSF